MERTSKKTAGLLVSEVELPPLASELLRKVETRLAKPYAKLANSMSYSRQ